MCDVIARHPAKPRLDPLSLSLSPTAHTHCQSPLPPPATPLPRLMSTASARSPLSASHPRDDLKKKNLNKNSTVAVAAAVQSQPDRRCSGRSEREKEKVREEREKKEVVNRRIASKKAISIILRREATKAVIEKKRGRTNSRKLLPRTVLEALHERITALRWESALKVFPSPSSPSLPSAFCVRMMNSVLNFLPRS